MFKKYVSAIVCTLVVAVIYSPAMVFAQPPAETADASAIAKPKPDLDYITPDAFAGVIFYPRSILKSPGVQYLPVEILSTVVKKELGIDPVEIEQVIFVAEPPKSLPLEGPPSVVIVLKVAGPVAGEVLPAVVRDTTEGTLDGKSYRKGKRAEDLSLYQPDDRTLIVGSDDLLRKVVAVHAAPAGGKLKTMLGKGGTPDLLAVVLVEPLRPALTALDNAPIPPPLAGLREAPKLIKFVAFKANVCDSLDATLVLRANDEAAAEKLGGIIDGLMTVAQQAADAGVAQQTASRDPVEQATAKYAKRMAQRAAEILRPVRNGNTLTTTISPEIVFPAPSAEMTAGLAPKKPDLDYIPADAMGGAILYPQSALKRSPLGQYLPLEIMSAAGKQALGFDPVEIEQAIAVAELSADGQPGGAVVLKMASPIAGNRVLPMLAPLTEEGTLDGKTYRKGKAPTIPSIYQADEKTLIIGTDAMLRKVVAAHAAPAEGKLKTMLGKCGTPDMLLLVLAEPLQPALAGLAQGPLGPAAGGLGNELKLMNYLAYKANVCDPLELTLVARAKDESSAEQLETVFNAAMAMQQQGTVAALGQFGNSRDPVEQALAQYGKRLAAGTNGDAAVVRKGTNLTLNGLNRTAGAGFAIGLLLPAVQAAREAGRRAQSLNNMHQINLAIMNYEATYGAFPPHATYDAQGKPLLSWRVAILPFIGQDALYKQFHVNEPWDSPNNKPLIALMPKLFQNPSTPSNKPGMANYLAVCGAGLMFDGTKGRKMSEITDGTSNTIAVVEADANQAVEWTKPQDWEYDATKPMAGLGHAHPAGFCAAFADGSVRFISASIDPTAFHAMLTIAGGETVTPP